MKKSKFPDKSEAGHRPTTSLVQQREHMQLVCHVSKKIENALLAGISEVGETELRLIARNQRHQGIELGRLTYKSA